MRRIGVIFCAATLACAQDPVTFRAGVSLVHVDAEVLAQDGRILTGFHKEDFRVFDERKEQPILQFAAEEQPLDLILLFDISGSMRGVVQEVADAARQGLHELQPGDRVCVMVFNSSSREVAPFTEDLDAVDHQNEVNRQQNDVNVHQSDVNRDQAEVNRRQSEVNHGGGAGQDEVNRIQNDVNAKQNDVNAQQGKVNDQQAVVNKEQNIVNQAQQKANVQIKEALDLIFDSALARGLVHEVK